MLFSLGALLKLPELLREYDQHKIDLAQVCFVSRALLNISLSTSDPDLPDWKQTRGCDFRSTVGKHAFAGHS